MYTSILHWSFQICSHIHPKSFDAGLTFCVLKPDYSGRTWSYHGQDALAPCVATSTDMALTMQDEQLLAFNKGWFYLTCFKKNMYLHFLSFWKIKNVQVFEIRTFGRQGAIFPTQSITWQLMTWWCKEPTWRHHWPWFWPVFGLNIMASAAEWLTCRHYRWIWWLSAKLL